MGRRWFFCRTYLDEALTCTLEVEVGMPRDLPCKFISGLKRPLLSGKCQVVFRFEATQFFAGHFKVLRDNWQKVDIF